jgi:hypothetical protein
MNLHHLPARAGTVHWGYFSASLSPALHVQSGDFAPKPSRIMRVTRPI